MYRLSARLVIRYRPPWPVGGAGRRTGRQLAVGAVDRVLGPGAAP